MKYRNIILLYRIMKYGAELLLCYGHGCWIFFYSNMTGEKKNRCPYIQEEMIADVDTVHGKSRVTQQSKTWRAVLIICKLRFINSLAQTIDEETQRAASMKMDGSKVKTVLQFLHEDSRHYRVNLKQEDVHQRINNKR